MWCNIQQRLEHESAFVGSGMRQDRIGAVADQPIHVDDVEIERAGGVRDAAFSTMEQFNHL